MGCKLSSKEAETEIAKVLPQMENLLRNFTKLGKAPNGGGGRLEGRGLYPDLRFLLEKVEAVEESIVSHELGLKGSVDAIVTAKTAREKGGRCGSQSTSLVCVELKTGHLQAAQNAHMAQLSLYTLMLHANFGSTVTDEDLGSGALLYVNNEGLHAIHIATLIHETKSLIVHRNTVASRQVLASRPRGVELATHNDEDEPESEKAILIEPPPPVKLPDLLDGTHSCKRCYTSRECMMYAGAERAFLGEQRNNHAFKRHGHLIDQCTGHLATEDFAYFQKWDRLIDIEVNFSSTSAATSWLIPSDEREKKSGKCICSLVFESVEVASNPQFGPSTIRLKRSSTAHSSTSLLALGLEKGCHAILSMDDTSLPKPDRQPRPRMHIIRGIMDRVSDQHAFLRASSDDVARIKRLIARSKDKTLHFRLDRDEVATGIGTLRQNLINLFSDILNEDRAFAKRSQRNAHLRRLLVHLETPTFEDRPVSSMFLKQPSIPLIPGCEFDRLEAEFQTLNPDQQKAARRVLTACDYAIIQGLPGTGKTSTIAFVVRLLVAHGKRVLITSYTHSAVDNVLLKLVNSGLGTGTRNQRLVRVGQKASCHKDIAPYLATEIAASMEFQIPDKNRSPPRPESLKQTMLSARVVGATALSVPRSPLLSVTDFDVVIVDEAGQINQPAIIGALQPAGRFVLVGDHMQLPPLVQSELAGDGGLGESLLKRLAEKHPSSVSQLTLQYRMAKNICELSNDIIYGGLLQCANDLVATRKLTFPRRVESAGWPEWVTKAMDPDSAVMFVDTDSPGNHNGGRRYLERKTCKGGAVVNDTEATVVRILVERLVSTGVNADSIGVICPYRAQIRILDEDPVLGKMINQGLELSTIDKYQGRDKDVIILSLVRSNDNGRVGRLLSDPRRLSVAVTRAKRKLIFVGSFSTLNLGSQALNPALDRIRSGGGVVPFT